MFYQWKQTYLGVIVYGRLSNTDMCTFDYWDYAVTYHLDMYERYYGGQKRYFTHSTFFGAKTDQYSPLFKTASDYGFTIWQNAMNTVEMLQAMYLREQNQGKVRSLSNKYSKRNTDIELDNQ